MEALEKCRDQYSLLLQSLVDRIAAVAKPCMIYLLGASLRKTKIESIFNVSAIGSQEIADCFVLVLIQNSPGTKSHETQDRIENSCKSLTQVTAIVLQYTLFEEWVAEGHPFARTVLRSAILLYNEGNLLLPVSISANPETSVKTGEELSREGLVKAKEFLAGATLFQVRKQPAMAAFMLHQSAEQALQNILRTGTGYYANTHNIERLIRYASFVSDRLPELFPQKTDQEKRLFDRLQTAYIDTRYKTSFKIHYEELEMLTGKVTEIIGILSDLVYKKVNTHQ